MDKKPLLQSRTLWFNLIAIPFLIGGIETLTKVFEQGDVPSEWLKYSPLIIPVLNMALRALTTQPLNFKKLQALLLPLIFLGFGGMAAAEELKVVCSAPVFAISGEDIFIDLRKSTGSPDRYHIKLRQELSGLKQVEEVEPGYYRLYSYVGYHVFDCIISNKEGQFAYHTQGIAIRSHFPNPPDNPEPKPDNPPAPPGPGPQPVDPDVPPTPPEPKPPTPPAPKPAAPVNGEYQLAVPVYDAFKGLPKSEAEKLSQLAGQIEGLSSQLIAGGGISTGPQLINAIHSRKDALALDPALWKDPFDNCMDAFTAAYKANITGKLALNPITGALLNVGAWQDMLNEAAVGVKAAAEAVKAK